MINKTSFYTAMLSAGVTYPFSHEARITHYGDDMAYRLDKLIDLASFARHGQTIHVFAQVMVDKVFVIVSARYHYNHNVKPDPDYISKGFTWFMSGVAENGLHFVEYHAIYDLEGTK